MWANSIGSTSRSPSFMERGLASARRRKNRQPWRPWHETEPPSIHCDRRRSCFCFVKSKRSFLPDELIDIRRGAQDDANQHDQPRAADTQDLQDHILEPA